jgi:hypothetical protein
MTLMQITGPIGAAAGAGILAGEKAVRSMFELMLICAILIGLLVLGGAILMLVRRSVMEKGRRQQAGDALEQIERLHRQGALSDGEFDRARRALVAQQGEENRQADKRVERTDDEG